MQIQGTEKSLDKWSNIETAKIDFDEDTKSIRKFAFLYK